MEATGLQRVDLSRNRLAELPPSVGGLGNLQAVFVRDNRLHGLPEELGLCVALEEIHADRNLLTTLPDSIGQLVNLRMLRLRDNRLQTVPSSLGNCSSLQCLDVRRPPLS
jgi:Leucine-rich repeat (LRR) protein